MCNSSLLEFLFGGGEAGASGPDVVEEEIESVFLGSKMVDELVGSGGLRKAGAAISADLDGVFGANEDGLDLAVGA